MPSLYDVSVPVFIRMLENIDHCLGKAAAKVAAGEVDEATLIGARLVDDMLPLPNQVQFACDAAKFAAQRVGQNAPMPMPDDEKSIADLRQRIATTIAYLRAADPAGFEGRDDAEVVLKLPNRELKYSATDYVLNFALPNFYFHVTTTYALLRMKGVAVGKMDYLAGANVPS
jgi:hypothetical protein